MRNLLLLFSLVCSLSLQGQELNCVVRINSTQIQTSDRGIFKDMSNAIEQFMNTRKWTSDTYKAHEKINCSMTLTITKMPAIGRFTATVQVQAARPVFNSDYNSPTLNFADRDWEFEYIESLPLEYNDNNFTTNLTSLLAVYAYIILGADYDSFAELGGTPYYQKALMVVNNAQQSGFPGWQPIGSTRNRYWFVENLTNAQFADVRKAMYAYHRTGLDNMSKTPNESRETILKALRAIKKARDVNPNAILIISFLDAKGRELANIFSEGDLQIRREAYDIITSIDPSNRSAYDKIIAR